MTRTNRVAPQAVARGLWTAGRILGLCAGLVLTACGGGGGGSDPSPTPPTAPSVVAPSIGSQPADAKVVDGATTTFSVTAAGSSLSYQWQRDGKAITGATGANYTTPVLHMADNGAKFQVVVSGPNTSVASSTATLTVTPIALSLTAQPQAQTAKDGEVVSFDVTATGSEPIQYQWQRNGIAIAGADKATYTTSALALADDAAVFKVVVTNPAGSVTSREAKLTVTAVAPRVVTAPESVTTSDGASVTFTVTAAGSAPLAYQWLRNGSPISGATGDSYTTALTYASSGDRFTVQVSNASGQVVSAAAIATVNAAAPAISQHPADATVATGGSATFTAAATGTAPLRYQWQQSQDEGLSWTNIAGATSVSHVVSSATLADANTKLRVAVSNAAATLNSKPAALTVKANIRILAGAAGGSGFADGKGSAARFSYLAGMSADPSGNIYLADGNNRVIRRVAPDGTVSLFAGKYQVSTRVDGPLSDARFVFPYDVLAARNGSFYVADYCTIRRISGGVVSDFVGDGNCQTRDGTGSQAGFNWITGMAEDSHGNLFVAEQNSSNGQLVRKITPAGAVSTLAGSATEKGKVDGVGGAARFWSLGKLAIDVSNNLYVADGTAIRQVSPGGEVSYYAGAPESWGQTEGYRTSARFGYINGLAFDGRGNLFVAESMRIARISTLGNAVTAVSTAWGNDGWARSVDGAGGTASAGSPSAMASLPDGSVGFYDSAGYTVRVVTASAAVTTLAGGGVAGGFADGVGAAARFGPLHNLTSLVITPKGEVNLADYANRRIRRLVLGTNQMDTVAGNERTGSDDGPLAVATFTYPQGLAYDAAGNLYVADAAVIRRISGAGIVSTLAGKSNEYGGVDGVGSSARFRQPVGMVVDSKGNLIVADSGNFVLRRIAPDGTVTTLAGKLGESGYVNGVGGAARLGNVSYLAIDAADNVYFTESIHSIRKMAPDGEVSPVAGAPYSAGYIDDVGAFARFSNPSGLAVDSRGNLYVADTGNNAIRRVTPAGQVSSVIGGVVAALRPGLDGSINQPSAIAVTPAGRLLFLSEGAIVGD